MILYFIQFKMTKNQCMMRDYIQEDLKKPAKEAEMHCDCEYCKLQHENGQLVKKITIDYFQQTLDSKLAQTGSNSCKQFYLNEFDYEIFFIQDSKPKDQPQSSQSKNDSKPKDQPQSSQSENDSDYEINNLNTRGPYKKKKGDKRAKEIKNQNHYYNNAKYLGQLLVRRGLSINEQIYLKLTNKNRGRQSIQAAITKHSLRKELSQIFKASQMKRQIQLGRGKVEKKICNMRQYRKMVYRFASQWHC